MNVSAVDKSTSKMEKIVIKGNRGRLPEAEIKRMVDEAEKFKREDDLQREGNSAKKENLSCVFQS